jgi:predicted TIM-barrel fold metal-dependent hydrolase
MDLARETALDPALPIIDSHHHLFDRRPFDNGKSGIRRYLLEEYLETIDGGHNVIASVFLDCYTMYRADGPAEMRELGEVEFANGQAAMSASGHYGPCRVGAAIVGSADLSLGDRVKPVLEASLALTPDRYRGVRISALWDEDPNVLGGLEWFGPEYYRSDAFLSGFAHLAPLGLSFDAFVLAPQLPDVEQLARRFAEAA